MPVKETCTSSIDIVELTVNPLQKLKYTVSGDAGVVWTLSGAHGEIILKSPADKSCTWTPATAPAVGDKHGHGLAMTFGVTGKLRWQVWVISAGAADQLIKDCNYENVGGPA